VVLRPSWGAERVAPGRERVARQAGGGQAGACMPKF
jgi:hypothetical protein